MNYTKNSKYNAEVTKKAQALYRATNHQKEGWVIVNGKDIDLTASGSEDWQIARNIINQLK